MSASFTNLWCRRVGLQKDGNTEPRDKTGLSVRSTSGTQCRTDWHGGQSYRTKTLSRNDNGGWLSGYGRIGWDEITTSVSASVGSKDVSERGQTCTFKEEKEK